MSSGAQRVRGYLLYTPDQEETFLSTYSPIGPYIAPELVLEAGQQGDLVGFRRAIHAMMHADIRSGKISAQSGRPIRQYTLCARPLGGQR